MACPWGSLTARFGQHGRVVHPTHWLIYAQVKQMQRNPNQVLQQLHKTMDPRMLQQMGGAQNLMNMMKQMSELEAKGGK